MGRALVSVTDKRNLHIFKRLTDGTDWEIISTGGTAKALEEFGIPYTPIEKFTGMPEMMDGRLKTLHPRIFGGILFDRSKPGHTQSLIENDMLPIDLVAVNLYNFNGDPGIEKIDIGGPSLLRAAAKNYASVTVLVDPSDYEKTIAEIREYGNTSIRTRSDLAMKVFYETYNYDELIYKWFRKR